MRIIWVVVVLLLAGCALRPRYKDLGVNPRALVIPVVDAEGKPVHASPPVGGLLRLQVLDAQSNQPVPSAMVEIGEGRLKASGLSNAFGVVELFVDPKLSPDALVVVTLPRGVRSYRLIQAPEAPVAAETGAPQ